jgi:hypothetical protein
MTTTQSQLFNSVPKTEINIDSFEKLMLITPDTRTWDEKFSRFDYPLVPEVLESQTKVDFETLRSLTLQELLAKADAIAVQYSDSYKDQPTEAQIIAVNLEVYTLQQAVIAKFQILEQRELRKAARIESRTRKYDQKSIWIARSKAAQTAKLADELEEADSFNNS